MKGLCELRVILDIDVVYRHMWTEAEIAVLKAPKDVVRLKNFHLVLPFHTNSEVSALEEMPFWIERTCMSPGAFWYPGAHLALYRTVQVKWIRAYNGIYLLADLSLGIDFSLLNCEKRQSPPGVNTNCPAHH